MSPFIDLSLAAALTCGGDNRLILRGNGLNQYGCRTEPREVVALGSCTCSSISKRGYEAAARVLGRLRASDEITDEAESVWSEHREQLRELMMLPDHVNVAFTPSGTDVELLTLALVAMRCQRRITNIVVGPSEVGSGTTWAADGLHYDTLTPVQRKAVIGEPVCPRLAHSCRVRKIEIRDDQGMMLDESLIDSEATEVVTQAVAEGSHALLHVVAHSKTGMHAPSLDCIQRITKHLPDDVSIVIDAAQGRISRRGLCDILDRDHLVMFTGSKFYGGPPFSGALMVPSKYDPQQLTLPALHAWRDSWAGGLSNYFTASEMPESWTRIRSLLPSGPNVGTLLRWSAALAEMDAYYQVSSDDRLRILRAFERWVPELFSDAEGIRLMPVFPVVEDDGQMRLLESKTTVFAFRVEIDGRLLNREELKRFHAKLNRSEDAMQLYTGDPSLPQSSTAFHLGQPVPFRDGSAALRIALGGEMIVRVGTDATLGTTLEERLGWLRERLLQLKTELQCLVDAESTVQRKNV